MVSNEAMPPELVEMRVLVSARCLDCGASVEPDLLHGRVLNEVPMQEGTSDLGGSTVRVVTDRPCDGCGGGRYEVVCDVALPE